LSLAKLCQLTGRTENARELLGPALVGLTVGPELPEVADSEPLFAEVQRHRVAGSSSIVDGVALKTMFDTWVAASEAEKP
jgi:hypothetical protein